MAGRKRRVLTPTDGRRLPGPKRRRSPVRTPVTRSRTRAAVRTPDSCSSSDSEPEPPSPQQVIQQIRLIDSPNGIKCPVCSKFVLPDDIECHLVMCLTKPRLNYNEDVLSEDKGECVICLEELTQGDTIARLPCLCIYHKRLLFGRQLDDTSSAVNCRSVNWWQGEWGDMNAEGRETPSSNNVMMKPDRVCIDRWFEVNRSCPEHPGD